VILHGLKTRLRLALPADAPLILKWENNPEFWPITEEPGPFTIDQIEEALHRSGSLEQHGQARWIFFTTDMRPVGVVDLFHYDRNAKKAGIGILIGDTTDRGRGYASDAIRTLLVRLRSLRQVEILECLIHTDNTASLHLFAQLGFVVRENTVYKNKPAQHFALVL
jgi:diamine N-acetyltransferase